MMWKKRVTKYLIETTEENEEKAVTNVPVPTEVLSHPFFPNEGNKYCSFNQIAGVINFTWSLHFILKGSHLLSRTRGDLTSVQRALSYIVFAVCFTVTYPELNPLKPELNPISYLLALLAHHFLHVSRIRVKSLTFRRLMSYIYGTPILDVSRSHTTTQHSR